MQSRKLGSLSEVAPGVVDFGAMLGATGHVACAECNCPWFEVEVEGCSTTLSCKNCGHTARGLMPNQIDQQGFIRCPDCEKAGRDAKWMAVIASTDVVCVGCKRCKWELRSSLVPEIGKIIV